MRPRVRVIAIVTIFILFFMAATHIYPEVKQRDSDIIKVAFMNGYVEAIKLESNEIQRLKADEELLRKHVEEAADRYLSILKGMNK